MFHRIDHWSHSVLATTTPTAQGCEPVVYLNSQFQFRNAVVAHVKRT